MTSKDAILFDCSRKWPVRSPYGRAVRAGVPLPRMMRLASWASASWDLAMYACAHSASTSTLRSGHVVDEKPQADADDFSRAVIYTRHG